ncbi:hypothetical protein Tco_0383100 [Tanacetum coccineum]
MALPAPNANWRTKPVNSSHMHHLGNNLHRKNWRKKGQITNVFTMIKDTKHEGETSGGLIEETEELIQYSPHISLNAINGTSTYQTMRICGHVVEVAGGSKLLSKYMCKSFTWKCRGEEFQFDVMLIPLGECEMVHGIQWLSTLGNILTNFKELRMEFKYKGNKVLLRDVFAIPTTLPPKRPFDYKIPLKEGTVPINSRPYMNPPTQKDAIGS